MSQPFRALTLTLLTLLATLPAGCGEDTTPEEAGGCACPEGVCAEGQCVLQVVINDACWGQARVFIGEVGVDAEPVGVVSQGSPFTTCEPFQAPLFDGNGQEIQPGESFTFVIESEDGRSFTPTLTQTCAGSAPNVFQLDACN